MHAAIITAWKLGHARTAMHDPEVRIRIVPSADDIPDYEEFPADVWACALAEALWTQRSLLETISPLTRTRSTVVGSGPHTTWSNDRTQATTHVLGSPTMLDLPWATARISVYGTLPGLRYPKNGIRNTAIIETARTYQFPATLYTLKISQIITRYTQSTSTTFKTHDHTKMCLDLIWSSSSEPTDPDPVLDTITNTMTVYGPTSDARRDRIMFLLDVGAVTIFGS